MALARKVAPNDKRIINQLKDLAFNPTKGGPRDAEVKTAIDRRLKKEPVVTFKAARVIEKTAKANGRRLEIPDPNPPQSALNLQLALTRLVEDSGEQKLARTNGVAFQTKYNLTNDQMLTLCRIALEAGAYKHSSDLDKYLKAFGKMDTMLKALSPDAAARLGIKLNQSGIIGSCSCCCR